MIPLLISILAQALDIATSVRATKHEGFIELHPLCRDANKKFVLWKGIVMKAVAISPLIFAVIFYPEEKLSIWLLCAVTSTFSAFYGIRNTVRMLRSK